VCVQFRVLSFPVRASAPGSRRIAAGSQNDACPCFVACAGIWRAKADSKAKTNRHFCPTAQAAKTAWTRCECAGAPEARTPVPIHRAPHLTRFHGVFAPNAALRAQLTPSGRGKRPATDDESTRANSGHRSLDEKRRPVTFSAAPQARVWHRREHLRPLCWNGTDRGQHRRTGLPRVHRPLMPRDTPPATMPKAKPRRQREAATNPQGRARPAVGNQREWPPTAMRRDPRDAEIPLANIRPAEKPPLARPPPTRYFRRKRRLNFLFSSDRQQTSTKKFSRSWFHVGSQGHDRNPGYSPPLLRFRDCLLAREAARQRQWSQH